MNRIFELMMSVVTARAEGSMRKQELGHSRQFCCARQPDPLSAKAQTIALTVS